MHTPIEMKRKSDTPTIPKRIMRSLLPLSAIAFLAFAMGQSLWRLAVKINIW